MDNCFSYLCSACEEEDLESVLWFTEIEVDGNSNLHLEGVCFICGAICEAVLTLAEFMDAVHEAANSEDEDDDDDDDDEN